MKLHELFVEHGTILSCKVAVSEAGDSKGYGFVQYAEEESAKIAIEKLNGKTIEGKQLYVAQFIRRINQNASFTNLYVKNLEYNVSEEVLAEKFSEFGKITSLFISKDESGVSRGFGFVNFESAEDAMKTKESMHGKQIGSKTLYVAKAQKRAERRRMLQLQYKESSQKVLILFAGVPFHGKPLYVAKAQSKVERKMYLQQVYAGQRMSALPLISSFTGFNNQCFTVDHRCHYYPPVRVYPPQPPNFTGWRSPRGFVPLMGHNQPPQCCRFPVVLE
ncbi:polyadenylate-binding protein 7-like [Mangifera indica]|uniref:polyadenylate-binding protein 7-like n=1 Tax=Mangifera indica TaxID=29780 RepID=UPI001CF96526|nr:polyadenylate-binding protein 7-like [Mangifera indica]